ncbi:MAG: tetratricopeptide repeat protein [Acidobacteriota bacterium]|nr:tetratricopeptide repeat protein [Acidobacteriota bacterium]
MKVVWSRFSQALSAGVLALSGLSAYGQHAPHQGQKSSAVVTQKQKIANPLNELLDEAQRDIEKKDFTAAIEPLQKFIAAQPDVAYGHFQLAYVYTAQQKAPEARTEYERAIALDPKMAEAYLNLGILYIESDPVIAIPNLRKAVELLPSQSRPRYLLGVAQERGGDSSAAAESFEGAYRLDPHNLEPLLHLANLYLRSKRPADAEAKFRGVLQIEPRNPGAMLGVAQSLDEQKNSQALEAYRSYLAVQPADSKARARLVHLLVEQQQYDVALAELDRADAGQEPSLESLRLRADIAVAQKKWDESIAALNKAIALAPKDAELHGGLGRIYMQKRDFTCALKELKIALQLDGRNLAFWKDLSGALYLSGDCQSTLGALDQIAKFETPSAGPWFIRALCYDKLNQPKPALDAYQQFLTLDQGRNADQVWQAQERSKVLRKMLEHKR